MLGSYAQWPLTIGPEDDASPLGAARLTLSQLSARAAGAAESTIIVSMATNTEMRFIGATSFFPTRYSRLHHRLV